MQRLQSNIQIGDFIFDFVTDITVESTWEMFTDTGEITIPRKVQFEGEDISTLFKKGDKVSAQLGYFPNLNDTFQGVISELHIETPIRFEIQDYMWLFKQFTMTKSFKDLKLQELLDFVLESYNASDIKASTGIDIVFETTADVNTGMGKFRINRATGAKVFEEIKNKFGLTTFVRGNTFYIGIAYPFVDTSETHNILFERNIISDDLQFQNEDDIKLKVKAISINDDNEKIEVEVGDPDGDERTQYFYNLSESDLTEQANRRIEKLKFNGYKGSFETFGDPLIKHGDKINLTSNKLPDRDGVYQVSKVTTSFGQSGYRQNVELDLKLS